MRYFILFALSVLTAVSAYGGGLSDLFAQGSIRYVFLETAEGRVLAERILGRRLLDTPADMSEFQAKLETGGDFNMDVEERLNEVRRRFEAGSGSAGTALTSVEQSLLRDLSRDLFGLAPSAGQAIEFARAADEGFNSTRAVFLGGATNPFTDGYEATRVLSLKPTRKMSDFRSATGIHVTARDAQGNAARAVIRVLSDNAGNNIQVIGEFNDWGRALRPTDQLKAVAGTPYFEAEIEGLKHGMQYRLVLNGRQVLDPAAEMFTPDDHLNSVFWDFERPGAFRMKTTGVDLRDRHIVLGETEVRALVEKWPNPKGGIGPAKAADTYRFVAESGVIPELKSMGYNAIEFLPFNMSNDGAAWHYRYQVYGLFAPDSRFGTPEEFARMIEAFNKSDIGVVADIVVGHFPFEGNLGERSISDIGLQEWYKADGKKLFGGDMSPWGTYRYDYANPGVRRHLVDSIMTMVSRYGISGLRFDNLDGIRFCPGGNDFLRELHAEIRALRPELWTNAEMFFGDNSVTASMDHGGLGLNSRTNSDLFDWFKEHARGPTEGFDMADLRRRLLAPLENWHEGSRVDYITSHDEAANGRGGFTGEYPATLLDGGGDWWVQRKSEVFSSLVMTSGSATMDMPQVRLLQKGNFSNNSAIDWGLRGNAASAETDRFLGDLSKYVGRNKAFNFRNMTPELENHTDYDNHVISFYRTDGAKKVLVVINLSHNSFSNYAFGVNVTGDLKLVLDNDALSYGGSGRLEALTPNKTVPVNSASGMHGKAGTFTVPYLPPASVLVFETP